MAYSALTIANYFIDKSHEERMEITCLKVMKLVYFAHAWYLALFQEPLINEKIRAWSIGPAVVSVYEHFKKYGIDNIELKASAPILDPDDTRTLEILDYTWNQYRNCTFSQLCEITTENEIPWEIALHCANIYNFNKLTPACDTEYSPPLDNLDIAKFYGKMIKKVANG